MDVQNQYLWWSAMGTCPPAVEESSFAFTYGGFGTHELVLYYDLVRELIGSCWKQLAHLDGARSPALELNSATVGDFLTTEVPRLERMLDEWLNTPSHDCHGKTPRAVIDRERTRLPEVMSGREAMIDDDCPLCQMLGEASGPMMWGLDGCNMDEDFAFDMHHRTREEWEKEQRDREEDRQRFNAEWEERERLGVTYQGKKENSVWTSSFALDDEVDVPLGVRLFDIGAHLAELIVDLRGDYTGSETTPQSREWIDQLNRDFGNLREVLQTSEASLVEALIDPVINHFSELLATIAATHPDLSEKCESLTTELKQFLDPAPPEEEWDGGDFDVPF
jgi:hypothetical protein